MMRIVIMAAIMNLATTGYLLFGRPDLTVREGSEKLFLAAAALEKKGEYKKAAELYETIFYDMSVTLIAPRAGERLADIYRRRLNDVEKAREVLRDAAAFQGSAYANAAAKDLAFMDAHWDADGSALKMWYDASNTYRSGTKAEALALLEKLIKDKPDASIRPVAMIRAAKIAKELDKREVAADTLRSYFAAYPSDTGMVEARRLFQEVQ
jgi:tetratricopeptide (TPR) repeat protein